MHGLGEEREEGEGVEGRGASYAGQRGGGRWRERGGEIDDRGERERERG